MSKDSGKRTLFEALPGDDILSQCIHCGMCLATCPTYEITKLERSSPRGRIRLSKKIADGEISISKTFADEMNFCLDCQACETACPAGVKYGLIVESARALIENYNYEKVWKRIFKKIVLKFVVAHRINIKIAARLLRVYQKSRLRKRLHSSGLFKKNFPKLSEMDLLSPDVSPIFSDEYLNEKIQPKSEVKYKVALLTGCLMSIMFDEINRDTVDVLSAVGCEVIIPKGQVCCGSLNGHNGDIETAKELARKNIDEFSKFDYEFLIINSSGCGAFMKEYGRILEDDNDYCEKAKTFSLKVRDVMEFLAEINLKDKFKIIDEKITYHDACHLVHSQKIFSEPRKILKSLPGVELKELDESSWCCGSAGIYNLTHYDDSMFLLQRKMMKIKETNANAVLAGNHGCIAQLKYGTKKFNVDVEVIHPISLLKRCLNDQ